MYSDPCFEAALHRERLRRCFFEPREVGQSLGRKRTYLRFLKDFGVPRQRTGFTFFWVASVLLSLTGTALRRFASLNGEFTQRTSVLRISTPSTPRVAVTTRLADQPLARLRYSEYRSDLYPLTMIMHFADTHSCKSSR